MMTNIKSLFAFSQRLFSASALPARSSRKSTGLFARFTAAGDRAAFSWPVREAFYRHVSAQIGNSVTVEVALETFMARLQRRKRVSSAKIVVDIIRRMRDGSTLADALAKWVPGDEVSVISSGELSGKLSRSLDLLVEAKRRTARVNGALKSSLVSPAIYGVAVYGMLWGIGAFVTPGLQQALPEDKAQGLVYGLYAAGDFAVSWWALLPPIVLGSAIALVLYSLPRWTGRTRLIAERVFPFSFYRDIQGYTWLMSFAALLRAGMADVEILRRQLDTSSPWLAERLRTIWWRMDNGASLPAALLAKGKNGMPPFGFPNPDIIDDIASIAGFPDFAERIAVLAVQWADELESATLARAKAFGFAMEVFMYVVMGVLMVAINSMSTQMGDPTTMPM